MASPVAIVTGASRGIGRHIALALARDGMDIVCAARSTRDAPSKLPGTIEETASEVEALGRRALAVPCDIRQEDQVAELVRRAAEELGRIDLLVNNAAVVAPAPFSEITTKRWNLMLDVNLGGTALCCRTVLPVMLKQGSGRIINVSSGAVTDPALAAQLGIIPYAVSKAAVEALTTALAHELQPRGIAVNCLRIESAIATEGAKLADPGVESEWEQPETAADAVRWLAAQDIAYTGHVMTMAEARAAEARD
ncbi:MAG: SDR family NAD(P)-dependent oxidoreductase [Chloroflexi bacterium]|nr:SDR family NAD(P)-dependent oxidoreductase [Chloroflexota bacterium]